MHTVDIDSWTDFPGVIAKIRRDYGTRSLEINDQTETLSNEILFRGHADSDWKLETTLERTIDEKYSVPQYLQRADSVVNEIESLTKKNWGIPPFPVILKEITDVQDSLRAHLPCYEYLVYLRHHGFPSPLLDWTRSPFVAAYFAFEQCNYADRCSVFAFIETPDGGKVRSEGDVGIYSMGPYITTDIRHFSQKAQYTIATKWDSHSKTHYFASHHDVSPAIDGEQDVLIKITIPRSHRLSALRHLEDYNISHYTLFQSEDSLIRSLGLRAFELNQ
ncbi:MAG: FRG domain-containing protein [Planctomycetaceae bacterium]